MPSILPSQIVAAIDNMFGSNRNEIDNRAVQHIHKVQVHALLAMLDEVPAALVDLNAQDYLEFSQCRAVLATKLPAWNLGDIAPANSVGGKDVIERIRRLMLKCRDRLPPPEPELPFIAEDDVRLGLEDRIQAAWTDFNAREWMGATILAGHVIEALLLWAMKSKGGVTPFKKAPDELHLHDLIAEAEKRGLITPECRQLADLAKDARNLIHPGKATRSGTVCSKATALSALSAVYRIAEEMKSGAPL
ncbi:MAG TPA: hypothetical protein VFA57_12555 [Pseudolabrys sp.]|nr:hypothetical protein [Pseudolabrys sp.]